jgi:hypothetical protein
LGGIPAGVGDRPAAADLESWGATWNAASYEYLIGVSARAYGQNAETASMPAFIESQRRLTVAISAFEKSTTAAINEFNRASTTQISELVRLSKNTERLTKILIWVTVAIVLLTLILVGQTAILLLHP